MQGKVVLCFSLKSREPDEVELCVSTEVHLTNDIHPVPPQPQNHGQTKGPTVMHRQQALSDA